MTYERMRNLFNPEAVTEAASAAKDANQARLIMAVFVDGHLRWVDAELSLAAWRSMADEQLIRQTVQPMLEQLRRDDFFED